MAYKLKKINEDTPAELYVKFSTTAANIRGVVFLNEVPVVRDFPGQFDKITYAEYKKILNYSDNRN